MADEADVTQYIPEEEQEIQDVFKHYARFPKLMKWIQLFLDKENPETWGNRTASALIAYNLDRNNPSQYQSARAIGYQNFTKLHTVAGEVLQQQGWTVEKQLELLTAKAVSSNNARFTQMLLEITQIYNPKAPAVQVNTQVNNNPATPTAPPGPLQIDPEEQRRLSADFEEFIDNKYKGKPAMNPDNPTGANR
jgi:hypothetical protein